MLCDWRGCRSEGENRILLKVGDTKIELFESTNPEGPIGKFIEKKGQGIHHIAFAVDNVNEALTEVEANGIQLVDK